MLACSLALINGGEVAWIEDRVFHQARNVLALSGPKSSRARSHRHDAAVNNARPHSKPNEAEVCERIARCGNKEHTERGINANDHERVFRVACVPRPTQPGDHQRVNAENKNDADEDEVRRYLSRVESLMTNHCYAKMQTVNRPVCRDAQRDRNKPDRQP